MKELCDLQPCHMEYLRIGLVLKKNFLFLYKLVAYLFVVRELNVCLLFYLITIKDMNSRQLKVIINKYYDRMIEDAR